MRRRKFGLGKGFLQRFLRLTMDFPLRFTALSLLQYECLLRSSALARKMTFLLLPNGYKVLLPRNRLNVYRAILHTYSEIFIYNEYSAHPDYRVGDRDIVLDIGAFVGLYTLMVADRAELVVSVEPNPIAFHYLKSNIILNGLEGKVLTVNVALGNFNGVGKLYVEDYLMSGATLFEWWHRALGHSIAIPVNVTTLTDLVRRLNINQIDVMKVDAEGSELMILKGGAEVLNSHKVDKIVMEIHLGIYDIRELMKLLTQYGYKIDLFRLRKYTGLLYARSRT